MSASSRSPLSVFAFYRDSPARRQALAQGGDDPDWAGLFPLFQELSRLGVRMACNLRHPPGRVAHHAGTWASQGLFRLKGYGGDFPSCFANLRRANASDVVWSTVDTTGIPLSVLRGIGALRSPLVYTSIGLVERLDGMEEGVLKRGHLRWLNRCAAMACHGWEESRILATLLPDCPVRFLPYGVDTERWKPLDRPKTVDVLSLGADWQRDFPMLFPFALAHPGRTIKIITTPDLQKTLGDLPPNVRVTGPVPLEAIPEEMAAAKVIALPVRENTYSGATTTLLQAMAMALPVVVSRVGAIREGYGFGEHQSCAWVPPGDADALRLALEGLFLDPSGAAALGQRARAHVAEHLRWDRLARSMHSLLQSVAPP